MQALPRPAIVLLAALAPMLGCEPTVKAPPPTPPISVALFDPLATPAVVPSPTDLAFTGGDGVHLNPPDTPGESAAQASLNVYLRRLNGFPASSTPTTTFSAPLDPASVTLMTAMGPGSVIMVDTTIGMLVGSGMATVSSDGKTLEIVPATPFTPGHRYAVLLFGGTDPGGLRGAMGEEVIASPTFFFLRSPNPLLERCGDPNNPACICPPEAIADPADTSCHSSALGLSDAAARQAEPQRRQLQAALAQLLPLVAPGRDQNNVVLFWTFTISTQPFTIFDPTTGNIPLPNDLLIDQTTHRVNLPITPGDPLAATKMNLNTLDGFSVSAPETIGVEGPAPVDKATLVQNRSVFFISLAPQTPQPEYALTTAFGQIVLVPTMPLVSDQNRYAVVITNGVADASGQALLPPVAVWLTTGPDPLFDGTHSTVAAISDAQAQQLEALRMAEQPLVQQLAMLGIPRTSIAGLWTFTTQSIQRPNGALAAYPTQAMLPTDVTLQKVATQADLAMAFGGQNFLTHVKHLVLGSFTSKAVIDPATGLISFTQSGSGSFSVQPPANAATLTVRFWLALPNAAGPVPVAFVQHGLTSWRGDVLPLADAFAVANWASVGFDIDFHGSRSKCTKDNQCASGTCNTSTGVCSGGFIPTPTSSDPLACDIAAVTADPSDCKPTISGQGYIDVANVFSVRVHGQQYIVDGAQLLRVLADTTNTKGLAAQLAAQTMPVTPTLDATNVALIGQSLGAIDGAVFLAASPRPSIGVLNVGGGHLFDLFANSPAFSPIVDQFLMSIGVQRGTAQYAQLDGAATWALDAADPWSVAPGLRSKPVIVQEAGMDMVIPPPFEEALSQSILGPLGLDAMHHAQGEQKDGTLVSTYFPTASHSELLTGSPVGLSMVNQAVKFLVSGGALLPAP